MKKIRHYFAEQAIWGSDFHRIIRFDSKKERDEFVQTIDYTNNITAAEAAGREYVDYADLDNK